jgi:hypothetical protein
VRWWAGLDEQEHQRHQRVILESPKQFTSAGLAILCLVARTSSVSSFAVTQSLMSCATFLCSHLHRPFSSSPPSLKHHHSNTTPQLTLPLFVPRHSLTYLTNRAPRPRPIALTYTNSSSACEECQHRERITTSSLERVIEDLLTCKQEVCLSHRSALYRTCPHSIFLKCRALTTPSCAHYHQLPTL